MVNYPFDPHDPPRRKESILDEHLDGSIGTTQLFIMVGGLLFLLYVVVMWILVSSHNERQQLLKKKK